MSQLGGMLRAPPPALSAPTFPAQMRVPMRQHAAVAAGAVDEEGQTDADGYEERDEAGSDDHPVSYLVAAACGACVLLVLLILLLCSFQGLKATEYGLKRNKMTGVVDLENVLHGGRNFVGFWNEYLQFPATIQSIEWLENVPNNHKTRDLSPMNVRTSDGLTMRLGVVVQYQIVPAFIPAMYQTYRFKYEGFFISNLRSALQVLVADYKAEDLWVERKKLSLDMKAKCDEVCAVRMSGMLSCWGVQLLDNQLDPKIEARIVQRQVEVQKQHLQHEVRKTDMIYAKTKVLKADYDLQIQVVKANATAFAKRMVKIAQSDAGFKTASSRKTAMNTVQDTVVAGGATLTASQVVTYMEKAAIIADVDTKMYYGDFQEL